MILSLRFVRRFVFPVFYLTHYLLSITVVSALLLHIPSNSLHSKYMTYAFLGVFASTAVFEIGHTAYYNTSWNGRRTEFALKSRNGGSLEVEIVPTQPLRVLPGQYINIWAPSFNPWSWFQGSSFIVTSWSADNQKSMKLLVKPPRRDLGFRWLLFLRAKRNYYRYLLFFSGPYGASEPVSRYETVLLVASDAGIFAIKPYVDHLFHCVRQKTSKARRLRLVCQLSTTSVALGQWVNELLYKDKLGKMEVS